MSKQIFVGTATALVTPFKNGKIDFKAYETILEQQMNGGIAAVVVCGTTGEPSTLTLDEQKKLMSFTVKKIDGFIPVIAGTGGNNTAEVITKSKIFEDLGADAQLCVTPYYNKTTQDGLVAHYTEIAENTNLPIILYNVPTRTGLNMLPSTVAKLADHPNIVALKEACSNIIQSMETIRLVGDKIALYSGSDELTYLLMTLGSKGLISVGSNLLPAKFVDLTLSYLSGEAKQSLKIQLSLLPFIESIFKQVSPIPIKAAMKMYGICSDEVRLPLTKLNKDDFKALKAIINTL